MGAEEPQRWALVHANSAGEKNKREGRNEGKQKQEGRAYPTAAMRVTISQVTLIGSPPSNWSLYMSGSS